MDSHAPTDQPLVSITQSSAARRPAGFWTRAAATLLDSVVIGIGSATIAAVVGVIGLLTVSAPMIATAAFLVAVNLGGVAYLAATESSARQATLGKQAFGLTVTDLSGGRVSFGRALGRAFAKYLNTLTLGLGWVVAAVTPRKRGLHDFVAGTVVVKDAGPHPLAWVATAAVMCALSVPLAGVGAAIAIPGLLRARMSRNEAQAIGALRAIRAAQQHYRQDCGGYAISLRALGEPRRYLHAEFTSTDTLNRSGYGILMTSAPGSSVRDTLEGCRNTVSAYTVQAAPVTPASGTRFFLLAEDGVIYQDSKADLSTMQPVE